MPPMAVLGPIGQRSTFTRFASAGMSSSVRGQRPGCPRLEENSAYAAPLSWVIFSSVLGNSARDARWFSDARATYQVLFIVVATGLETGAPPCSFNGARRPRSDFISRRQILSLYMYRILSLRCDGLHRALLLRSPLYILKCGKPASFQHGGCIDSSEQSD
jgi:hypothetical protein